MVYFKTASYTLNIPVSDNTPLPSSLKRIDLKVEVAGRNFNYSVSAQANQIVPFTWDGQDAYGRVVKGTQPLKALIGYVYDGSYQTPAQLKQAFGYKGNGTSITANASRQEIILWRELELSVGAHDAQSQGLGGWTPSVRHAYDPASKMLYLGDGSKRSATDTTNAIITTVTSSLPTSFQYGGKTAVGPDGSVYVAHTFNGTVFKVASDGSLNTVLGAYSAYALAVGRDGSLYIGTGSVTNANKIIRRWPDGTVTTVAGTGIGGFSGDGGPATQAQLSRVFDIAVGPDDSLYIADADNDRIRRVGPDGIITTVAGSGDPAWHCGYNTFSGDGGPATQAKLDCPYGVAVAEDGTLYIVDGGNRRIRRVDVRGIITTITGPNTPNSTNGQWSPNGIALGRDGSFYVTDASGYYGYNDTVWRIASDGSIFKTVGIGTSGFDGDGGPANQAKLSTPLSVAIGSDDTLYISDNGNRRIRRVSPPLPGFTSEDLAIASEDSQELYQFDLNGRHLRTVNALTGATRYQFAYDSAGRLASITDGDGNVTTIEHDSNGNPTAIVAPFGQRTALTVDSNGYLASVANPAGETYRMSYTTDGLLTRFADPKNNAATMNYDSLGRLLTDTNAAGGSQTLARAETPTSYEVTHATALGRTSSYRVEFLADNNQRRFNTFPDGTHAEMLIGTDGSQKTTAPDGTVSNLLQGPDPRFGMLAPLAKSLSVTTGGLTSTLTTERTANLSDPGNPLSLTRLTDTVTLNGRTATSVYTAATRTATATSAAGRQSTAVTDAQGHITQAQVPGLATVNASYDSRGRPSNLSQSSGGETRTLSFAYNMQGYLQTVTDPLGRTVNYAYDAAGRVTTQTLPDGRQIQYDYDANGNLVSLTPQGRSAHVFAYTSVDLTQQYTPPTVDAGNSSMVYAYNADKQLTQINRPDGQTVNFAYDSAGRLSTLTTPTSAYDYDYNAVGKLASIAAPESSLAYSYSGALLTQAAWTGAVAGTVDFGYDNDFRLTSVSVNSANPVTYQYDPDSLLIQAGDLILSRNTQNGLLTGTTLGSVSDSLSYNGFGEVASYSATANGVALFSTQYTRDVIGRITQKQETIQGSTDTFDYGYDTAGRLVQVSKNGTVASSYAYDANGNRLSKTVGGSTINGTYDAQDRLTQYGNTTYTYTANGELASKTAGGQTTAYQYDVLGNLRRVTLPGSTVIEYVIDGANRRVGKKVNGTLVQGLLYQDGLKPVAELDGSGQIVSRFVYATGVNVPDYLIKGGATYRIVKDHIGSPRLVVDTGNGNVVQQMDYDEFGNVLSDTNPGFQPFGFAGGLYDRDTWLVRFGARDYDAETGRWTAKDPIGFGGGDTNLYGYVVNNPINKSDLIGLDSGSDAAYAIIARKPLFPGAWNSVAPSIDPLSPNPIGDALNTELSHKHIFVYNAQGKLIDNFGFGPKGFPFVLSQGKVFSYNLNNPKDASEVAQFVAVEKLDNPIVLRQALQVMRHITPPLYAGYGWSCQNFAEQFSDLYWQYQYDWLRHNPPQG